MLFFLIIIYKPHNGICSDVHLSATLFTDTFVHFDATQLPYPSKDTLYKTEKKIIFHFQLTSDDISDILVCYSYASVLILLTSTLHYNYLCSCWFW